MKLSFKTTVCIRNWVLLLIVAFIAGCYQPQIVEDKWGWERPASTKSKYEFSLTDAYYNSSFSESMNEWRVLNHMMYFLARESVKWEGPNSQTATLLAQLQELAIQDDSVKVMNIYRRLFINEDKRLDRGDDGTNQFIDSILAQARLPQILKWGAFDSWLGLDGLGFLITRVGPLDIMSFSDTSLVGVGIDRITYEAIEDEYSNYTVVAAADGPIDMFIPLGGHPKDISVLPLTKTQEYKKIAEKIRTQHQLFTPVEYALLEVERIIIIGLPGPENISVEYLGDLFYSQPWEATTIDIEMYFNLESFESKDSLDFSITYNIHDLASDSQVVSETKRFLYDVAKIDGEAFSIRILTAPITDLDSCRVDINVNNNEKFFTHTEILNLKQKPLPLEIVRKNFQTTVAGLPFFDRSPIKMGDSIIVFVPISDLPKNQNDSEYSYIVTAFLIGSDELAGFAKIDPKSFEAHASDNSTMLLETDYPVYDSLIAKFGDSYICSMPMTGEYSKTYFSYKIKIPDKIKFTHGTLMLNFYQIVDYQKKTVSRFATAAKEVMIE